MLHTVLIGCWLFTYAPQARFAAERAEQAAVERERLAAIEARREATYRSNLDLLEGRRRALVERQRRVEDILRQREEVRGCGCVLAWEGGGEEGSRALVERQRRLEDIVLQREEVGSWGGKSLQIRGAFTLLGEGGARSPMAESGGEWRRAPVLLWNAPRCPFVCFPCSCGRSSCR